jgi:hypothetical protein
MMAHLDGGLTATTTSKTATPTTTKTAKALTSDMRNRTKTIVKAQSTGDAELIDYALRHPEATSMKKVRRGVWLAKADQAQRLGDHVLAKSYTAMAKRATKVAI